MPKTEIVENQLQVIVKESGLEATKAQYILTKFQDYFEIASEWETKARTIKVTNASQVTEMQMARVGRLFLREKRINIEKARKELKEQALREGKAIDGIANVLKALIEPIEEYLDRQERFVEIQREAEIEAERIAIEKKIEEERIAKEKAYAEELEKKRIENEKLKKEAEEREKKMKAEREKAEQERLKQEEILKKQKAEAEKKQREADAKAQAEKEKLKKEAEAKLLKERKEREKIEAELRAKKEAEEEVKRLESEKIETQKNASDKEKLLSLITVFRDMPMPEVKSKKAIKIISQVESLLTDIIAVIEKGV